MNYQAFTEFCRTTSAHGFFHLISSNKLKQLIWTILIMGAYVGFTYECYSLFSIYFSYPKKLVEHVRIDSLPFPDITICPAEQFSHSKLHKYYGKKYFPVARVITDALNNWTRANKIEHKFEITDAITPLHRHILEKEDLFFNAQDHFISCKYMNRYCDFRNFTRYWHPTLFACYRFAPDDRRVPFAGYTSGLQVLLNYGKTKRWKKLDKLELYFSGYFIKIHPQRAVPYFYHNFIRAGTGSFIDVSFSFVNKVSVSTSNDVCVDATDLKIVSEFSTYPKIETYKQITEECREVTAQQEMIKACGCLDDTKIITLEMFQKHKLCNSVPKKIILDPMYEVVLDANGKIQYIGNYQNETFNMMDEIDRSGIINRSICSWVERERFSADQILVDTCKQFCNTTFYPYGVVATDWPPKDFPEAQEAINAEVLRAHEKAAELGYNITDTYNSSTDFNKLLTVHIYPSTENGLFKLEERTMPATTLFSSLGGILGLWTGYSLMTIVEIVELCYRMIVNNRMAPMRVKVKVTPAQIPI